MNTESSEEQTRGQIDKGHSSVKGTMLSVDPNDPRKTAEAMFEWIQQVSGRAGNAKPKSGEDASSTLSGQDDTQSPTTATKSRVRTDLPVINIGEGDLNADWIKHVDGGRHQRNEFRAHEQALIMYYEREGRMEEAEAARKRLKELGPWEYGEGERRDD